MSELTYPRELMLRQIASGPVSYVTDGERCTVANGQVFAASTYFSMVGFGWGVELPEVD